jgi:hypothetical protein
LSILDVRERVLVELGIGVVDLAADSSRVAAEEAQPSMKGERLSSSLPGAKADIDIAFS